MFLTLANLAPKLPPPIGPAQPSEATQPNQTLIDSASKEQKPGAAGNLSAWAARHPALAITLVSLLAVMVNCYPVVFCGRSFVSPTCTGPLVYSWWPPLPGPDPGPPISAHGSDTGAMMVWGVPMGFLEARSLLQDGELPLWDRYGHAGTPLIGQGNSMLADPLQWIVILGGGSAGAWDVKFLAAKVLFCAGFGLLILRLLGNRPLALLYAALAAYCGAFFYINNHLVFFPFAYSPWILLAAMELLAPRKETPFRWGLAWLLANVACFNGGHVEVGVVLIVGLNLAALAQALAGCGRGRDAAVVAGRLAVGTGLFLGLTAPVWVSFLAALEGSYSMHSVIHVYQLSPTCLAGLFDDRFYRWLMPNDTVAALAPGCSLLVLAGCLLSAWRWRLLQGAPFFWINSAAIVLWGGCVFGWVPRFLLEAIPFLNRVEHNFVDFSYLLILHLTIQSAYGFSALAQERKLWRAAADALVLLAGMTGLVLFYCLANPHRPVQWNYVLSAAAGAIGAPLLFLLLKLRSGRISAWGWTGIVLLGLLAQFRFGLYTFGNENLVLIPGPREPLNAPSPAITRIQADRSSGPFRVVGFDSNLLGDYAAVYGLEDIRSAMPLTSGSFMGLVVHYPGVTLSYGWTIKVADPVAAQPLLNLLNVKYLLAPPGVGLAPDVDYRLADRSDFGVVENLEVWPRAFFTDRVLAVAGGGDFINQLWAHGKRPFAALTPQEIQRRPGLERLVTTTNALASAAVTAATNYRLGQNATGFDIHATTAGVVCLTETQARDFTATANGRPTAVLTVNDAFKGVYLDRAGDYRIAFRYRPRHWALACAAFWLAVAGTMGLLGLRAWRTRRGRISL